MGRALVRVDVAEGLADLAAAEARTLGAAAAAGVGLYLVDDLDALRRAGLTLSGGEVVAEGPPGGPLAPVRPEATCVLVVRGAGTDGRARHPLRLLARLGWAARAGRSGAPWELYPTARRWWLLRAAALRHREAAVVHRTSASLPARVARAVVNLVARPGDRVLDPVCGAGVLLVEAGRAGCAVEGGDLSGWAVNATRENLAAAGVDGQVRKADALAGGEAHDAVVADLPYGFRHAPIDLRPFCAAIPPRGRRWAIVAHVDLSAALRDAGHAPREVIRVAKRRFTRFVHVG